jgi:hypothetical protein
VARLSVEQGIGLGFLVGCGVGAAGMYFGLGKQLKLKYNKIADSEIQDVKDHYRAKEMELLETQSKIARQGKPDINKMSKHLKEVAKAEIISEQEGYRSDDEEEEPEEKNIFDNPPLPPWNYDREMQNRSPEHPFVIHIEEFEQSEYSHQTTFTYYEGDDTLVDETGEIIMDMTRDGIVGEDNLTLFGHGSNDPHLVYVRNTKLQTDYEIIRDTDAYARKILGLEEDPTIEHSAMPRRRQRFDDDG